jgi:uracil-DNA glycosylase
MEVQIEASWNEVLRAEFEQEYFKNLVQFLKTEKLKGKVIYPEDKSIFNAFNQTPFQQVKVVILGQDPYHGDGQAHGLCFSVQEGIKIPPSLLNIYKEMETDLGKIIPSSGNLLHWAKQGVLMLNASLTVEANLAMSHSKIGWEVFTNRIIELMSQHHTHLVFILWGKFAQEKERLIDASKHCILKAAHPSPLSAHNGFWGSKHFSKTNAYLKSVGKEPIDW